MRAAAGFVFGAAVLAACSGGSDAVVGARLRSGPRACAGAPATALGPAQAAIFDCGNGGTTVTVAGSGQHYLVVAELATDRASAAHVPYVLAADTAAPAAAVADRQAAEPAPVAGIAPPAGIPDVLLPVQRRFDAQLRARERTVAEAAIERRPIGAGRPALAVAVPAVGSVRDFRVLTNYLSGTDVWRSVGARLEYAGGSVLVYVDTVAPDGGFTPDALQRFGDYFDRVLFPIDTAAFGRPSDVDGNGHVIMLMSPVVNEGTPRSTCATQGYVAGFFNGQDFHLANDPNSNGGEIFYSVVADPQGRFGCPLSTSAVTAEVPAVFLHEMQHLISYAHHVLMHGAPPAPGWMDEGLSLVAEELGVAHYESQCPPPACRTDPSQLFPDSAAGFARTFMLDSYFYAEYPDSVSITTHDDGQFGFAWRGGAWAFLRWLGDHAPDTFYRQLEDATGDGIAAIEAASGGQAFGTLFANFGLALYTDSMPGLPRTTAPAANRFRTRNPREMWGRLLGNSASDPLPFPIPVHSARAAATAAALAPGGIAYWRLDTAPGVAAYTLRYSAPDGSPLDPAMRPQLAIFRLPDGQ